MEDFVTFELAKKLREKGFECKEPFAMYNELGVFHKLYSSAEFTRSYDVDFRDYYDYDDFDERDFVAPTIAQVLKWLREEKRFHIGFSFYEPEGFYFYVQKFGFGGVYNSLDKMNDCYATYEETAIKGIEYVIDKLI